MHDAGLSNSPETGSSGASGHRFEVTDEQLSAELRKWTGATPAPRPVGELLDRHWEAAFTYARLCTDGPSAAGILTTAAFTRLFGEVLRQAGPTSSWRPHLLLAVRRIAAEWAGDHRREMLHPRLRVPGEDAEQVAARLLPPPGRRVVTQAFPRLPQPARALLWHTEVEAEPLAIPAGLLGLDEDGAHLPLRRARERLREECLQVHRELAPRADCARYARLLDVTYRRPGVGIDPDLRQHLADCAHCRDTADQLAHFVGSLGTVLAEGVLGWAAGEYLRARAEPAAPEQGPVSPQTATEALYAGGTAPGFPAASPAPEPHAPVGGEGLTAPAEPPYGPAAAPPHGSAGTPYGPAAREAGPAGDVRRPLPPETHPAPPATPRGAGDLSGLPRRAGRRARRAARRRHLAVTVAAASGLVVLPLVLWSALGSSDGAGAEPAGAGASSGPASPAPSYAGSSDTSQGTLHGRLHNVASGLCVGLEGGRAVEGAEAELTSCSSGRTRQWVYEPDGLLHDVTAPRLCLDSHLGYSVRLAPCPGASRSDGKNVRYDFTLQGLLVPRWNQDLALTPAATDGSGTLVLKNRTDDPVQRWMIDTSEPDLQMAAVDWDGEPTATPAPRTTPTPRPPASTPAARTRKPSAAPATTRPAPTASASSGASCSYADPYACSWGGGYGPHGPGGGYREGGYGYGGYGGYGYGGYGYGGYGYGRR
ncbi:ricin-type beta-trefoil lectin domain protein [Streptomyces echinoruber]|uniref:RICIN domain-containing protein n=1 Tax=Streptomyces echinoruber TaxID=68898 RepID=UPI00360F273A